jgi:hypothetical protein
MSEKEISSAEILECIENYQRQMASGMGDRILNGYDYHDICAPNYPKRDKNHIAGEWYPLLPSRGHGQ